MGCKPVCPRHGRLDLARLLLRHAAVDGNFTGQDTSIAAANGSLNAVKWLLTIVRPDVGDPNVMDEAAIGGQLEVVKWLHENRTEGCTT